MSGLMLEIDPDYPCCTLRVDLLATIIFDVKLDDFDDA